MMTERRVAIVTGAGQGIGTAIARRLASDGAAVVVAELNLESAGDVVAELTKAGGQALAVETDVAQAGSVQQMVDTVLEHFGRIDVLVNNAGTSAPSPVLELAETDWRRVLDINLTGPFLCSQAAARAMLARGRGRIVNIASVVSQVAHPTQSAYCASKAGLVLLTKVMAAELGGRGITVNAVSPGAVDTPRLRELRERDPEFVRGRLEATPLRRYIAPEEVANVVAFLASPEADAITGANIVIDGGSSSIWAGAVPSLERL